MGCVKETSKALAAMPLVILFPVAQGLGFLVFMVAWTFYGVHLASMGEFSTNTFAAGNLQVTASDFASYLVWRHFPFVLTHTFALLPLLCCLNTVDYRFDHLPSTTL